MEWIFVDNLTEEKSIEQVESEFKIKFPKSYVETVKLYNGGTPKNDTYDTESNKERIFERLLNYNLDKKGNILETYDWLKADLEQDVYPFGMDPFGNYICFDYKESGEPRVIYYNHENRKYEKVADNFLDFINKLY